MKALSGILAIGILTILIAPYTPWWCCGLVAFVIVLMFRLRSWTAFFTGLAGVALGWGILAGWIDGQNHSLLSGRIGNLFGGLSPIVLILVTALIGGLVGGLAALTGGTVVQLLYKQRP